MRNDAGTPITWNRHGDATNQLTIGGTTLTLANTFSYDSWGLPTTALRNLR